MKTNAPNGRPSLSIWAGHYAGQLLLAANWGYAPRQIDIPGTPLLNEEPFLTLQRHVGDDDVHRIAFAAVLAAGRLGEHILGGALLEEAPRVNSFEASAIRQVLAEMDYRRESVADWYSAIEGEVATFLRAHQRKGLAVKAHLLANRRLGVRDMGWLLRGVPQGKAYEFYLCVRIRAAECECRRTRGEGVR